MTDKILPRIEDWQNRPLDEVYPILYIDAIHYSVRDNGVIRSVRNQAKEIGKTLQDRKDKYRIGKNLANHSQQKDTAARGDYLDLKIVILK